VISDLNSVLTYQNDDVVNRFSEDYNVSFSEAQEIFLETKRWLWLCAKQAQDIKSGKTEAFRIPLFNEANAIDLMWHTFLIYTHDYAEFCQKYFGFFIHHFPTTKKERDDWKAFVETNPDKAWEKRKESLEKVYGYLYDELGPEILLKWCEDFPQKYQFTHE
jgi:hypothetical protein